MWLMDEDAERIKAVSFAITRTVIQAYARRFPLRRAEDQLIILNSMVSCLLSFLHTMHPDSKDLAIDEIIDHLLEAQYND